MQDRILNRYQPLYEAGSGGFASVVVAYDTTIRREVAIKCIPLDEAQTQVVSAQGQDPSLFETAQFRHVLDNQGGPGSFPADFVSPFKDERTGTRVLDPNLSVSLMDKVYEHETLATPGLEEARTAAQLNDASIVQIYDFEIQDSMAYLIMEYVEGMSVGDLLRDYPDDIDADVVAAIFKSVAHALQTAHKNHVLHLDIKPDNILINQKGQVKVVDFGLARLADEGGFGSAAGGTIGYMPIEQMRREELDERCDEWALASLTYELITGSNHFFAPNLSEAEDAIFDAELVLPSLCMDDVDEAIDDILFCALEPYRDERYDTVKAFAKELQPCLGSPKEGAKKLAEVVSPFEDDEEATDIFDPLSAKATDRGARAGFADPVTYHDVDEPQGVFGFLHLAPPGVEPEYVERSRQRRAERISSRRLFDASYDKPPFDPLDAHTMSIWLRVWSLINVAIIAFMSASNIPYLGGWASPLTWAVVAVLVIAAFVWPHIGALLGLASLGAMLFVNNAPVPGVILVVAGVVWWVRAGRFSNRQAAIVLSPALFGCFGFCALVPFLAGWLLRPVQAVVATLMAGFVSALMAGLGSLSIMGWDPLNYGVLRMWNVMNDNYWMIMQDPAQWIILLSWLLAAFVMALFCSKLTRLWTFFGSVASFGIMLAGLALASFAERGGANIWIDPTYLIPTIVAGVVMFCLSYLGSPYAEDE